jgi:serine phosphatase RsbU (regulator of sigma subunit)
MRVPVANLSPSFESVIRGSELWLESAEAVAAAYPQVDAPTDDGAAAVLPLRVGRRPIGFLAAHFATPRVFDEDERVLLRTLAALSVQAVERARLYEHEHGIAEVLQRGFLPERLPEAPGVELAAAYLPAAQGLQIGGDWYDALELEDGSLLLAVGDVVGHDVEAARAMGQVRNALRAYALEEADPPSVLRRVNRLVHRAGRGAMTTLALALVAPSRTSLRTASAGHPPLLLATAEDVSFVDDGRGLPLGAVEAADYEDVVVPLEPGATVLLYTDGLVERRDESIADGLTRLAELAEPRGESARELLDRLLASGLASGEDDVALLVARLSD